MAYDPYHSDIKNLHLHPYKIMLGLLLAGVTMLFVSLTLSYLYQRVKMGIAPVILPPIFGINALLLLASSWTLHQAKKAYLADNTAVYTRQLFFTVFLTLIFVIAQFYGWKWMQNANMFPDSGPATGYLYALAILHLLHVAAGLPFFLLFLYTATQRMKEPISVLIYFSDPHKRLKLRLLEVYWHYLDVLWVYLVLFFSLNYLIV